MEILAKREASVSTRKLQELCHWGKERGCFKTPETMFSVTEWRELGDKLWDETIKGSRTTKAFGQTWREVMNHLLQMVAEKKMA